MTRGPCPPAPGGRDRAARLACATAWGAGARRYGEPVRVIGGTARGRRLRAPRLAGLRPTSDRVKEAIFDVLMHLGAVEDATVVDLFAGSGALGIEALSRGARSVTFVDADRAAVDAVTANLEATGLAGDRRATVVRAEALGFAADPGHAFDLALVDPPYAFDRWTELLGRLRAGTVVLESARPIELGERFELHRQYRYGTTLVTVANAPESLPEVEGEGSPGGEGSGREARS